MTNHVSHLEARYRTLAEATAQVIWVASPDGEVTEVSDSWVALTGHPPRAALGRRFLDLVPPEDVDRFAHEWQAALASNRPFETEFRLCHADGHWLYVKSRSMPVFADGRMLERIGTLTDLTATKVAEEARRMSEARFATAFDASPTPMAIRDAATHRMLAANQAYLDLTGYTLDELTKASLGVDDPRDVPADPLTLLPRRPRGTGRRNEVQAQVVRKSGEAVDVMVRSESVEIDGRDCTLVTLTDVTERVRAETALRASEDMFSKAFTTSPIAMTIRDTTDGNRLLRGNQAYFELTGYDAGELLGKLPDEVPLFTDRPTLLKALRRIVENGGRVRDFQAQLRRKSGELANVLIRSELIDIGGRACALSTVADVSALMQAQQALAESEERFRRLSEAAWEGIGLTEDGVLIDVNPQLASLLGYEPAELIGRTIADLVAPEARPVVADHVRRESTEPFEHDALRKDGSTVRVEVCGRTVPYKGRMIRMTAVRDISDRRNFEASRRALLAATAGVSGADFFKTLVSHLCAACRVRYAFVSELLPSGDRMRAIAVWSGKGGLDEPLEYPLDGTPSAEVLAHGTRFYPDQLVERFPAARARWPSVAPVSFLGMPLLDTAGKPIGVLAILHDETIELGENVLSILTIFSARASVELERIHAEAEVRRLTAELEQRVADRTAELRAANDELESFSYSVSHDLRAPLRHIAGFVELLLRSGREGLDADARGHLDEIAGAASRMGELIDNLLEFSRVGRAGLHPADVELDALARDVIAQLARETGGRHIDWDIGDLPIVRGDRNLLWQVFYNLLANAVKYTRPRDGARIEIGVLPSQTPGQAVCFVRDNGVGFDMRYVHKLFGVFQRLHSASVFEGTGIGLANVQRIVQRHGGRVWAEGAVDTGATFYLSLPAAPAPGLRASLSGEVEWTES